MRKNFVFFALVPMIIVVVLLYFFLDTWVEAGLEYAGEKAVGAKVEIDNFSLTLSPLGARLDRLQVADPSDPWSNIFETRQLQFAVNFGQLLRGKYIIETMEVNDLVLGTKRTTDGSVPKEPESPVAASSEQEPSLTTQAKDVLVPERKGEPMFDLSRIRETLNIDSLTNPKNLASYTYIDSLKAQVAAASVEWQETVDSFDASKTKLVEVEASVKSINVGAIKDVQAAMNALNSVKAASAGINEIAGTVKGRKNSLTGSVDQFSASIKKIDDIVEQDYKNAMNLAQLPDLSTTGLASLILGKDVMARAYTYLGYVDMVREKVPQMKSEPPIESPKRLEGQIVHFPAERSYPKFWIQKILLSGGTDKAQDPNYFYAKGEILNITNDQRITGRPITADINALKGRGTELNVRASIDRRKEEPLDEYAVDLSGVPVSNMSLGQSSFLPSKVTNASLAAGIEIRVPGNGFDSHTKAKLGGMKIQFERDPKNTVERIVRDVLATIVGFSIDLRVWKNVNKFDVAFATDLDDQITARTKAVLGAELDKIRADIKSRINKTIAAKRQELEKMYAGKRDEVLGKAKAYESQVNEKLAVVETKKKELEAKVESEKNKATDSVKKKAGDALKKILK